MANVKLQQKLGATSFQRLVEQQKTAGVHVVFGIDATVTPVSTENVMGRVVGIYPIGKKMDVYMDLPKDNDKKLKGSFRFVQANEVFYLQYKE